VSVSQFASSIARIQEAKPDWLMMYITGQTTRITILRPMLQGQDPMGSSINIAQGYEHRRFDPQRWRDSMSRRATWKRSNSTQPKVRRAMAEDVSR